MRKEHRLLEVLTGICLIVLFAASALSINGYARASQDATTGNTGSAAQGAPAFMGQKEKLSYALGMVLGKQFRDQSLHLNLDLYVQGLKDALAGGKTLLTPEEARASVNALQRELKRKRAIRPASGADLAGIKVSFKLDPRLTRSQYMGDRWVSPPTFTSTLQAGTALTVEARAQGLDSGGRPVKISPEWIPADPKMVTVSPHQGNAVKIVVKRTGESSLKVVSQDIYKELHIKATGKNNAMQVKISQHGP